MGALCLLTRIQDLAQTDWCADCCVCFGVVHNIVIILGTGGFVHRGFN